MEKKTVSSMVFYAEKLSKLDNFAYKRFSEQKLSFSRRVLYVLALLQP